MHRRTFVQSTASLVGASMLGVPVTLPQPFPQTDPKPVRIRRVDANFEREPLVRPFGFKGVYMTRRPGWRPSPGWTSDCSKRTATSITKTGRR